MRSLAVLILSLSFLVSCGGGSKGASGTASAGVAARPGVDQTQSTAAAPTAASTGNPALLDPTLANATAPDEYRAKFETSKGDFVVAVHRSWAPAGADRFYNLVKIGFFDDVRFFRAIAGFMVQFGINGDPKVSAKWRDAKIPDDPRTQSNTRGRVTFAKSSMPNSRTTQVFVSYGDNSRLDATGFAPFGEVESGMDIVDSLYTGYGEGAPGGSGPSQSRLQAEGNAFLAAGFPKLDWVKKATIVP
jgi:peptidyl-prolyl cis-trans isomerase A (cyclophilin A)